MFDKKFISNKFNDIINIISEDVHSDARRKAKVDYETYHVVHNKKSGTTFIANLRS